MISSFNFHTPKKINEYARNEWMAIFVGHTLEGLRNFNRDTLIGWIVEDSCRVALDQGGRTKTN
ncbi:MAG: hypothetical protein ACOC10_01015 [Bacteroidota bacterium]